MQLIPRRQNNGRQQQVEKELIVKAHTIQHTLHTDQSQDQPDNHSREDGDDGLVDSLDFTGLQDVAEEEGADQQHDEDEQGPGGGDLLLGGFGGVIVAVAVAALPSLEDGEGGADDEVASAVAHDGLGGGVLLHALVRMQCSKAHLCLSRWEWRSTKPATCPKRDSRSMAIPCRALRPGP